MVPLSHSPPCPHTHTQTQGVLTSIMFSKCNLFPFWTSHTFWQVAVEKIKKKIAEFQKCLQLSHKSGLQNLRVISFHILKSCALRFSKSLLSLHLQKHDKHKISHFSISPSQPIPLVILKRLSLSSDHHIIIHGPTGECVLEYIRIILKKGKMRLSVAGRLQIFGHITF